MSQCDKCNKEATVHEIVIVDGKPTEKNLCAEHAREEGLDVPEALPVEALFKTGLAQVQTASSSPSCPECGMTWAEFRRRGLLGCAGCYEAFESQLSPLIERAHEGGAHHRGRQPPQAEEAGIAVPPQARIARVRELEHDLRAAVEAEQYEKAARLRDELRRLQTEGANGGSE